MEMTIESSCLVKPHYEINHPLTTESIPLSVFDKVADDSHFAGIFAYRPPTPPNSLLQSSLSKLLSEYREWAGRFGEDSDGNPVIVLNDKGVRFVEASVASTHDQAVPIEPSPVLLSLHPRTDGVEELLQLQLTRFACGTVTVGYTTHHRVADGHAVVQFFKAWARLCRGFGIGPVLPTHDRLGFFPLRNPPHIEFEHRMAEFKPKNFNLTIDESQRKGNIVVHRAHYSKDFINQLKAKASSGSNRDQQFSTFVCLMAQIWRAMTKSRGLDESMSTHVRINVNGRSRMRPHIPDEYFGNLVLWAFPRTTAHELIQRPLHYAAGLVHDAIMRLDDKYFKSFIDFANSTEIEEEDLGPLVDLTLDVISPHVDVLSWHRFPISEMDFGGGGPFYYIPSYFPVEGLLFITPSFAEDGSIDVYVSLFEQNLDLFKKECYSLQDEMSIRGDSYRLEQSKHLARL